jgi:hypothetical protein
MFGFAATRPYYNNCLKKKILFNVRKFIIDNQVIKNIFFNQPFFLLKSKIEHSAQRRVELRMEIKVKVLSAYTYLLRA